MGISGEFSTWLIFLVITTLASWLPWCCCVRKKKGNMAIYSHWSRASDRNLALCDSLAGSLFCMFPLFSSSACLYRTNLSLDVMWIHSIAEGSTANAFWFAPMLSEMRCCVLLLLWFVDWDDSEKKAIRKRMLNILAFPSFFIFFKFSHHLMIW